MTKARTRTTDPQAASTRERILDIAEGLVQTQGFNAFSYADIAAELHLTKASLHYHFPTKADLGRSLVERYRHRFLAALTAIDESDGESGHKLQRYVELYANVLRRDRMCLCGMLAADFATLPRTLRSSLQAFFDTNERWLAAVLEAGRKARRLKFAGPAKDAAAFLVASLEGAMLLARSYGEPARFDAAAARLLGEFGVGKRRATAAPG